MPAMKRHREAVSDVLSDAYKRRRELDQEIEHLEMSEAKQYYEAMEKRADYAMHGVSNAALCKELDYYYNAFLASSDATLAFMKRAMMQQMLAYEVFDKIPYEKWDKYCAAIYEQCDLFLDSSIDEAEFEENRHGIIDEANE